MSTRSMIGILNKDGTITASYCHSDGYLTGNGALLLKQYSNESRVCELISWGDMSSLGPVIIPDPTKPHSFDGPRQKDVCVFYGRDRGESNTNPHNYKDVYEYWRVTGQPYLYLFVKGAWYYLKAHANGGFRKYKLTERNTQKPQK